MGSGGTGATARRPGLPAVISGPICWGGSLLLRVRLPAVYRRGRLAFRAGVLRGSSARAWLLLVRVLARCHLGVRLLGSGSSPAKPRWDLVVLMCRRPHVVASVKVHGGGGWDNVDPAIGSVLQAADLPSSELITRR